MGKFLAGKRSVSCDLYFLSKLKYFKKSSVCTIGHVYNFLHMYELCWVGRTCISGHTKKFCFSMMMIHTHTVNFLVCTDNDLPKHIFSSRQLPCRKLDFSAQLLEQAFFESYYIAPILYRVDL